MRRDRAKCSSRSISSSSDETRRLNGGATMNRPLGSVIVILAIYGSRGIAAQALEQTEPSIHVPPPPVSLGDEASKPTRGFVSALVHNLGTDVKHMPTIANGSWLVAGGAGALLVTRKTRR